jgi:hypothetical protein
MYKYFVSYIGSRTNFNAASVEQVNGWIQVNLPAPISGSGDLQLITKEIEKAHRLTGVCILYWWQFEEDVTRNGQMPCLSEQEDRG